MREHLEFLGIDLLLFALLFLAMPWLAIAFRKYCKAIDRLLTKRKG